MNAISAPSTALKMAGDQRQLFLPPDDNYFCRSSTEWLPLRLRREEGLVADAREAVASP
jgi:hypothetical protein